MLTAILLTLATITLVPGLWIGGSLRWVHRNIGYVEQESHGVRLAGILAVVLTLLGVVCIAVALNLNLGD